MSTVSKKRAQARSIKKVTLAEIDERLARMEQILGNALAAINNRFNFQPQPCPQGSCGQCGKCLPVAGCPHYNCPLTLRGQSNRY